MVKKSHQTRISHPTSLSNVTFDILSQIDLRQLKDFQKTEFLTYVKDREVKEKEIIEYKDVKLRVVSTHPYGVGKITGDTSTEVLFRPTVIFSDIIFAINTSYSMKFKEIKPSKFEAVVSMLQRFLEKRLEYDFNDRIGVISFNHDWVQVSELRQVTQNYIEDVIEELKRTKLQGRASVTSAITGAMDIFKLEGDRKRVHILVLITDTMFDPFDNPIAAVKDAKNNLIAYPIVIGPQETREAGIASQIAGATSAKAYHLTTHEKLEMALLDMADHFRIVPGDNTTFSSGVYLGGPGGIEQKISARKAISVQQRTKRGGDEESIIMVGSNIASDLPVKEDEDIKDESTTIKTLKMIKRALWD